MANQINIYSTRTMMAAIEKMMPVRSFIRDTFFSRSETYLTEDVDVDFKKGKRKMAPFVAPRVGGKVLDRQGYRTQSYKTPRIAPVRILTKDDLNTRLMGENVYSKTTPAERAAQILGRDLAELDDYISRREEWMCREVLVSGKVTCKGYIDDTTAVTIDQVVDYGMTNKETLAGIAKWDVATSTKYADIKRWRLAIVKASGRAPNVCLMSNDVADLFMKDTDIRDLFNKYNMTVGKIEPRIVDEAVTYIGTLVGLGLEIYTYDEWFLDDAGIEQPMMPTNTVILARTDMAKRIYGAVTQMDESGEFITIEGERVPKKWSDTENEVKKLKVTSRPLPVPEDIDDWYVSVVY